MSKDKNPFLLKGYDGPDNFCDREEEVSRLKSNIVNGVDTTLIAVRRMGKTGLIHHLFKKIATKNRACIYIDIYATQSLEEFTEELIKETLSVFPEKRAIGKRFLDLLRGLNPVISYDPFSGAPEVRLAYAGQQQKESTVRDILYFLDKQGKEIVLAIDEFQQIVNYPEKNVEALLRTVIQHLKNTRFIFSGSKKHMLLEMFNSANRPFFASTQPLFLEEIPAEPYKAFIKEQFRKAASRVDEESLKSILNWTLGHTYYVQAVCNKLYSTYRGIINQDHIQAVFEAILEEQAPIFFQYRSLLTTIQWKLLIAIAKEGRVSQPTAGEFVFDHGLTSPTTTHRALESLIKKEMVLEVITKDDKYYRVYDVFLLRWLARTY